MTDPYHRRNTAAASFGQHRQRIKQLKGFWSKCVHMQSITPITYPKAKMCQFNDKPQQVKRLLGGLKHEISVNIHWGTKK